MTNTGVWNVSCGLRARKLIRACVLATRTQRGYISFFFLGFFFPKTHTYKVTNPIGFNNDDN